MPNLEVPHHFKILSVGFKPIPENRLFFELDYVRIGSVAVGCPYFICQGPARDNCCRSRQRRNRSSLESGGKRGN
jgi:hypothetical protein